MTRYATIKDLRRNISPDVADESAAALAALRAEMAQEAAAYLQPARTAERAALDNAGSLGGAVPLEPPQRAAQSIVLPYPPSANRYWRNVNGRIVVSADAKAYKSGVWLQAQHAHLHPFAGPVAVYVHAYRPRKVGDLDNANKVLLDALCGIAYQDDAQIVELHSWRHDDAQNPRVEVEVRTVQP